VVVASSGARQVKPGANARWRRWELVGSGGRARNAGLFWKHSERAAF
jgi:hypothetical protein